MLWPTKVQLASGTVKIRIWPVDIPDNSNFITFVPSISSLIKSNPSINEFLLIYFEDVESYRNKLPFATDEIVQSVKLDNVDTPDDKVALYHLDVVRSYFKTWPSNRDVDILQSPTKLDNDACELFIIAVGIVVIPVKVPLWGVNTVQVIPFVVYSIKFPFVILIKYWPTLIAKQN